MDVKKGKKRENIDVNWKLVWGKWKIVNLINRKEAEEERRGRMKL